MRRKREMYNRDEHFLPNKIKLQQALLEKLVIDIDLIDIF